jgi:hypothetical protein
MVQWYNWTTFDIIADLVFGKQTFATKNVLTCPS